MTKNFLRFVAVLLFSVIAAPAIADCAGWAVSAAGRHACCANRGAMATETSMRACCGMTEQSAETAPAETQLTRTPVRLLGPHFAPVAVSSFSSRTLGLSESPALLRAVVVPLYLQQASLLI